MTQAVLEQQCDALAGKIRRELESSFKGKRSDQASSLLFEILNSWHLSARQLATLQALLAERQELSVKLGICGDCIGVEVTLPSDLQPHRLSVVR